MQVKLHLIIGNPGGECYWDGTPPNYNRIYVVKNSQTIVD